MGQTLSEPVTDKHTSSGSDDSYVYGCSEMQGWRVSMEDAHTTILKLSPPMTESPEQAPSVAFFAVYDGHGGFAVAKYAGNQLHNRIASDPAFLKGDYATAIKSGFLGLDVDLRADENYAYGPSGCTAVCAIITDNGTLIVGNSGDSRAVLSARGLAVPLSFDHKPGNPDESKRIFAAGGFVEFGRVNGNLALSRALGDFDFKGNPDLPPEEQIVTADPVIMTRQLNEDDEFLVLACDGIWDCMSNEEVIDFVRLRIGTCEGNLGSICEAIMAQCLASETGIAGLGCDNMTVIIVGFLQGKSIGAWAETVKRRIEESGKSVEKLQPESTNGIDCASSTQSPESSNGASG